MKATGPVLFILCGECLAHAGHGAALAHGHADWIQLICGVCVVIVAAIAARSRK